MTFIFFGLDILEFREIVIRWVIRRVSNIDGIAFWRVLYL